MKTCTKCGQTKSLAEFRVDRQRPDGRGTWCKPCVRANTRRRIAAYRAETGERYQDRTYPLGECEDCGAPIRLRPTRKTELCRRCQSRVAGRNSAALRKEEARQRRLPVLYEGEPFRPEPKPVGPLPSLRRRWYMGYCPRCGEAFIHDQPQTKTCSAKCTKSLAKARRRARQRDAFVEDVSPREVFERDRWTCHLCGTRVARSKEVPHPRAPVVDHVVPLAAGRNLGGVHAPHNARCAHFLCNSIKSDRLAQAALF